MSDAVDGRSLLGEKQLNLLLPLTPSVSLKARQLPLGGSLGYAILSAIDC